MAPSHPRPHLFPLPPPHPSPLPPTPPDFATELKRARLAAGLSQGQVAEKAGVTGSYVCLLELRRKPSPSEDVVRRLARALAIDEAHLIELAAMDRTPETVRRRVMRLVREHGDVRRTRDALLTTTIFHMTRQPGFWGHITSDALGLPEERLGALGRIAARVKAIPTIDQAESRSSEVLDDVTSKERDALVRLLPALLSRPPEEATAPAADGAREAGHAPADRAWRAVPVYAAPPEVAHRPALDTLHVDRRVWQEGAWFLVADDDDAYPRIEKGDLLLLHPHTSPEDGDLVAFREGSRVRVRSWHRRGDEVRLDSPRTDVPPIRIPAARFEALGVVAWVQRPLRGMPVPRRSAERREGEPGASVDSA
jgi:transcriptional regulator with XRE-family HTH domain